MRFLTGILMLAGCSPEAPREPAKMAFYVGQGRDRLCIKGERIGFIAYGEGNSNCSVRGRVDRAGEHLLAIVPEGDEDCRIPVQKDGGTIRLGQMEKACAYYCGPGATFTGKAFAPDASATPAVDFGGDPLC